MAPRTDWRIYLLGYDFTDVAEWGVDIEETLGQPSTATFTLQDRALPGDFPNAAGDFPGMPGGAGIGFTLDQIDVKIEILGAPMPLFHGMVLNDAVDLPEQFPWRRHTLQCTDYQREIFDRRIIAPTGSQWLGPDSDGNYIPTDMIQGLGLGQSDGSLVANLFDPAFGGAGVPAYLGTVDATTFVTSYTTIPGSFQGDVTTIRALMEWAAGHVSGNLQYWMDPLFRLHWQIIPRWFEQEGPAFFLSLLFPATPTRLPSAPVSIDNDTPNGTTTISCRDLKWSLDYSAEVHQVFVSGGIGMSYNGGAVDLRGTGWVVFGNPTSGPVMNLPAVVISDGSSVDTSSRVVAAMRATNAEDQGVLRGSFTVGGENSPAPDGWHVGQVVKITDSRMPAYLNGRFYTIQRVSVTLIPDVNRRVYKIEWGDAPTRRASTRRPLAEQITAKTAQEPGVLYDITGRVQNPLPGSTVFVTGQLMDAKKSPVRVSGVNVNLELHVWDDTGTPQLGVGAISPAAVTTDEMGQWETAMTVGPQKGWHYCVCPVGANTCHLPT